MNETTNIPFITLEAAEACLSNLPTDTTDEVAGKALRTLIILERLVDTNRISISSGYEQAQVDDYRRREENIRSNIVEYAARLDSSVVRRVVDGFGGDDYYQSALMAELKQL